MKKTHQKTVVISKVREWADSEEEANRWFNDEFISALGCTPSSAIDDGKFDAVIDYIESIRHGGCA